MSCASLITSKNPRSKNSLGVYGKSRFRPVQPLTRRLPMVSIPKIIGVVSCSAVLCLSLSNVAQARMSSGLCADKVTGQPNLLKCDEETLRGIDTIKGEVLRVEDSDY